jgi:hypothetical protein
MFLLQQEIGKQHTNFIHYLNKQDAKIHITPA